MYLKIAPKTVVYMAQKNETFRADVSYLSYFTD